MFEIEIFGNDEEQRKNKELLEWTSKTSNQ
jgi:hypothetical protein